MTQKVAAKRWQRILKNALELKDIFYPGVTDEEALKLDQLDRLDTQGHYKKFNGTCDCGTCKTNKHYGKYNRAKAKKEAMRFLEDEGYLIDGKVRLKNNDK